MEASSASSAAAAGSESVGEVLVRFTTAFEEYRVPTDPIAVPANLNRVGLSAIVSHLLGGAKPSSDTNSSSSSLFEFTISAGQYAALRKRKLETEGSSSSASADSLPAGGRTLLRTTLRKYLSSLSLGLSTEDVVTLDFFPQLRAPNAGKTSNANPDWVAALACGEKRLVAGLTDGSLALYAVADILGGAASGAAAAAGSSSSSSSSSAASVVAHAGAVSGVSLWEQRGASAAWLASSGQDGVVRVWELGAGGGKKSTSASASTSAASPTISLSSELGGAGAAMGGVSFDFSGRFVASGDAKGNVLVWKSGVRGTDGDDSAEQPLLEEEDGGEGGEGADGSGAAGARAREKQGKSVGSKRPRAKSEDDEAAGSSASISRARSPVFAAAGRHSDRVSDCVWLTPSTFASGGWDHTVVVWDVEATSSGGDGEDGKGSPFSAASPTPVVVLRCGKVVTSIAASPLGSTVATAHPDHTVRLWDSRGRGGAGGHADGSLGAATEGVGLKSTLGGLSSWVSSVSWCPTSSHYIAAASYAGETSLWDVRAPAAPLYQLTKHEGKALAVCWGADGKGVASGGSDARVRGSLVDIAGEK